MEPSRSYNLKEHVGRLVGIQDFELNRIGIVLIYALAEFLSQPFLRDDGLRCGFCARGGPCVGEGVLTA
jgi:hypothetical protein